ncbi:MAG TPA: RIP metalloprotease RseP [Verrucomicrobiae bacterium]|jgi:regulator of sigma E protease|nr:RIP metalloprotease RseP [Verrucomicrobiae bacterium]
MQILVNIGSIALILGVLVFIHELGHYAVAKWCGVRVEVFSIGFGKRLWGFRRGETDYRISVLPLGGYVKMAGENPLEDRTGDPGEFTSHPRWQRFLIAIAGPLMNVLFTIGLLTGIFMFHNERVKALDDSFVIGAIADGSSAQKSGLQPGDKIIRIQDVNNPNWQQVSDKVILNPNQPIEITVQRGNEILTKTVVPQAGKRDPLGEMGWEPLIPATVVKRVEPNLPGEKIGMQPGDEITALNGVPLKDKDFTTLLQEGKGASAEITFERNGQQFTKTVTPYLDDKVKRYRLGLSLSAAVKIERLPLGQAFNKALDETQSKSLLVFELLGKLVQSKISIKVLQSPVGMSSEAGQAFNEGPAYFLAIMAFISLQLGIFNLLPIPILDGGLMLMLLIEGTLRRDINQQIKERLYQAAFVCLVLFASVVIFNDVAKGFIHH